MDNKIRSQGTVAGGAEPPFVLTVDIGSSSTRVLLYDRLGRAVNGVSAQERSGFRTAADGTSEADPDDALERAARCIDKAVAQAGALVDKVGAVALDTLVSNILAIDGKGRPITPLITYADTRNDSDADELRKSLDEGSVHERTGCPLRTSYWPARLAWFRRVQPDTWRKAARWITLGEYVEMRLFGHCRVSLSVASWSGLLDRRTLAWDGALLEYLGVGQDHLSPLVDVDAPLSGLKDPYSDRWPALRDVPWFPAVGDGAAANVGSGCTRHERMALTIGTSGAMRVVQPQVESVPRGLWCYRVDRQHALLGGATSEGGNVYSWLQRTLKLGSPAEVEKAVRAFEPDSHGLTVLPFLAGERSPDWAGNVRATFDGITLSTTPLDILCASLEAVAYRFALIHERICDKSECDHRLIASGGALLKSPAWMQIFADVIGRPVVASTEPEATSHGAAILALRSLGAIASIDDVESSDGAVYEPDDARHAVYRKAVARQRELYERVINGD
jgi:gluconokinase